MPGLTDGTFSARTVGQYGRKRLDVMGAPAKREAKLS